MEKELHHSFIFEYLIAYLMILDLPIYLILCFLQLDFILNCLYFLISYLEPTRPILKKRCICVFEEGRLEIAPFVLNVVRQLLKSLVSCFWQDLSHVCF